MWFLVGVDITNPFCLRRSFAHAPMGHLNLLCRALAAMNVGMVVASSTFDNYERVKKLRGKDSSVQRSL